MSDTPDTDQRAVPHFGFYSCATVPAEFARKLERERDEAREHAQKSKAYKRVLKVTNENLKRERDEAREELQIELEMWRDGNIMNEIHRNELEKVEQERDEAREHAQRFRSLHYSHLEINASASWFPWEEKLGHE